MIGLTDGKLAGVTFTTTLGGGGALTITRGSYGGFMMTLGLAGFSTITLFTGVEFIIFGLIINFGLIIILGFFAMLYCLSPKTQFVWV